MRQSLPDTARAAAETLDVQAASDVEFCRRALERALARQQSTLVVTEALRRAAAKPAAWGADT